MKTDELYIMPETVKLISVADLSEAAKNKFEYEADDFVLTHSGERTTSKVIDGSSAILLKEFREPRSWVEAVFKYAVLHKLDPQEILKEVYPLLIQLRGEGFLLPFDRISGKAINGSMIAGDLFRDYKIIEKLKGVSDTEIYKVKKDNRLYALKILKTSPERTQLLQQFHNEEALLKHLNGRIAPLYMESGETAGDHYIIMEWCEGQTCDVEAGKYRNLSDESNLKKMMQLSLAILSAYSELHHQGVLHGDIHPRNILISGEGEVRIIDFGLSQFASNVNIGFRGGLGFFYEPEYANAILEKRIPPACSFAGEQYALAAILYLLVTGKTYVDFSYDKETLFKQIALDSPVPFKQYDLDVPGTIENTLLRALSKEPENRFSSVGEFAIKLSEAAEESKFGSVFFLPETKLSYEGFCDAIKIKYGFDGKLIQEGLKQAPTSSVNYGNTGIAYMLYRMGCIREDSRLLAAADVWVNVALPDKEQKDSAFYAPEFEITPATVGETSIYHSESGIHLVQALINRMLGDAMGYQRSVAAFITASSRPCKGLDLTTGKTSSILGCAILKENSLYENKLLDEELDKFALARLTEVWDDLDNAQPGDGNTILRYHGIAHGWAGILYATLKWCNASGKPLPPKFFDRVDQLIKLGIPENDMMRWNLSPVEPVSWPGWCHGSAGHSFLWTLLYKKTKDEKFLEIAEKTARHFLTTNTNMTNGSLCCGMSGEAYALLGLFNATQNSFYLDEVKHRAKKVLKNIYNTEMKNHSLYKGDVGAAVLFSELTVPEHARMPLFE